jgi:hypothetical protein
MKRRLFLRPHQSQLRLHSLLRKSRGIFTLASAFFWLPPLWLPALPGEGSIGLKPHSA